MILINGEVVPQIALYTSALSLREDDAAALCFRQILDRRYSLTRCRETTIQRSSRLQYGERSRISVAWKSNLCARIATVDREAKAPLSELSTPSRQAGSCQSR
jgi:hypothetical protein